MSIQGLNLVDVSLSNEAKYVTSFNIKGVQITMRCGYNTRNKLRWIILLDSRGNVLLPQTFLKSKKRCELGFLSNQYGMHYYVTLKAKDYLKDFKSNHDYLNWSKDFNICFVGYDYEDKEKYETLVRKLHMDS